MTCSLCGDVCRCVPDDRLRPPDHEPHFESEAEPGSARCHQDALSINRGGAATGERPFAASQEKDLETPRPKFVVNQTEETPGASPAVAHLAETGAASPEATNDSGTKLGQANFLTEPSSPSWRDEVTERLHRYRARRRPREPRYPSLRLKFEAPEARWTASARSKEPLNRTSSLQSSSLQMTATRQSVAMDSAEMAAEPQTLDPQLAEEPAASSAPQRPESTAKIIAFPRPAYAPPVRLNELAEPVFDRPRILEAPEVVPPPPALGGITIEETAKVEAERQPGIDMPLQPGPLEQRILAAAVDWALVLLAVVGFSAIFYQSTHVRPPLTQAAGLILGLIGACWAAYQYLLVVYSGTTPGLRMRKLQLQRFDGAAPSRRLRRWRVLASWLSGISLGMGYAWQFLDEDALYWHERVTKTYLAPIGKPRSS